MRLLILTFGDQNCASTLFRWIKYIPDFEAAGWVVEWAKAKDFKDYERLIQFDVVVIQKTLLRASQFKQIRKRAKRLIYDVDDRIWLNPHRKHSWWTQWRVNQRIKTIVKGADLVLAANQVLMKDMSDFGAKNVKWLPMALDEKDWKTEAIKKREGTVVIGWAGAPVNLKYLNQIEKALCTVKENYNEVAFKIYSGQRPKFIHFKDYEYIEYQPGTESSVVKTFDIGLLPLPDDDFANGKSPIKAIQYLACGAMVVASDTRSARGVLGKVSGVNYLKTWEEWNEALLKVVEGFLNQEDETVARQKRIQFYAEHYAQYKIKTNLLKVITEL
jgi:hypothetical protein